MSERGVQPPLGRRDGVAIVLVLGLLSLLMVLAVAFSVSMRIERAGAGNYAYSIGAKHMIQAALSRAMMDIDATMHPSSSNWLVYPATNILASAGSDTVKLGWGSALKYIPDSLSPAVGATVAGWTDLEDPNASVVGRCAYVAVNCSGLLDAGRVGGSATRASGSDPNEIQLYGADGGVPDIGSVANAGKFNTDKNKQAPYETLQEFRSLNTGLANPNAVSSFSIYSLSPEQTYVRADGTLTNKAYVGGAADTSPTGLKNPAVEANILRAFADSGILETKAQLTAYNSLLDYVDTDSIPTDLADGCTERVPMINKVVLTCRMNVDSAGLCDVRMVARVCVFYPFYDASLNGFTVEGSVSNMPDTGNTDIQFIPNVLTLPPGTIDAGLTYGCLLGSGGTTTKPKAALNTATNHSIRFSAEVKAQVHLDSGELVDSVPYPFVDGKGIKLKFVFDIPALAAGIPWSMTKTNWAECIDPRFNWDPSQGSGFQWAKGVPTLTALKAADSSVPAEPGEDTEFNKFTEYLLERGAAVTVDKTGSLMVNFDGTNEASACDLYVPNRVLQSVGELGNLCVRPWSSIRLYDHQFSVDDTTYGDGDPPYHAVLDCFTVSLPGVAATRGRVNINTFNVDALAAVFHKAPELEFLLASDPDYKDISWMTATKIAADIVNSRASSGSFNRLSDIGRTTHWPSYVTGVSDIAREGPIRNSAGLLTVRDNLYTILLATGEASRGMGEVGWRSVGDFFSYRRAVAVVWRDPFPVKDASGEMNHFWFVRYLNMLDD